MDSLVLYVETKDITYAHKWLDDNKNLIRNITRHIRKKHHLQHISEEELLQEAYVLYYSVIPKYNPSLSTPYTFLYLALGNALVSKAKELGRADMATRLGMLDLDYTYEDSEMSLSDILVGDKGDYTNEVLISLMRDYINTKCDARTQLLYKLYTEGRTNTEIAKVLGVSKWMVTLMLRKLIEELKEDMKAYEVV